MHRPMPHIFPTSRPTSRPNAWASRWKLALWAAVLCGLCGPAEVATAQLLDVRRSATVQCQSVTFGAQSATCSRSGCTLSEAAWLRCDTLLLSADRIELAIDPQQAFAGAQADGHALLVEGTNVVRCTSMTLAADRITGQIDAATLELYQGAAATPGEIPEGRRLVTAHGALQRHSARSFTLQRGDFTLCDCGAGSLPSWRLDISRMDLTVGERATLYAPLLRIHLPFTNFLLPLTPPLLPLSLPLRKRALGFLPPELKLFGSWPTVDLPLFMPLGDSYDLTVSPGLRTDWATPSVGLQRAGAPRLGMRLRYAPVQGTRGCMALQLTEDKAHAMATRQRRLDEMNQTLGPQQIYARRGLLTRRLSLDLQQRSTWGRHFAAVANGRWVSDDLVLQDFALAVAERYSNYWPSRAALSARFAQLYLQLSADYMLRLDNVSADAARPDLLLPAYSNTDGSEAGTLQRGPAVQATLLPTSLGFGLLADAELTYVRYGTWSAARPHASLLQPPQTPGETPQETHLVGAVAGLQWANTLGPVHAHGRAAIDALGVGSPRDSQAAAGTGAGAAAGAGAGTSAARRAPRSFVDTAMVLEAEAELRLARHFATTTHYLMPRLVYGGLPLHGRQQAALDASYAPKLEARLRRRSSHQLALALRQSLWARSAASGPWATWELSQPVDLRTAALLQPSTELALDLGALGSGGLQAYLDLRPRPGHVVRDLSVHWMVLGSPVGLSAAYDRLAPDADRFERSLYELAAPRVPYDLGNLGPQGTLPTPVQANSAWVHTVRGGAQVTLVSGLTATYNTVFQLPRPGQVGGDPACASPAALARYAAAGGTQPLQAAAACFTQHALILGYASPCRCWGIQGSLSVVPQDLTRLRYGIALNLADIDVARASSQ
jgi:hypothetical protein